MQNLISAVTGWSLLRWSFMECLATSTEDSPRAIVKACPNKVGNLHLSCDAWPDLLGTSISKRSKGLEGAIPGDRSARFPQPAALRTLPSPRTPEPKKDRKAEWQRCAQVNAENHIELGALLKRKGARLACRSPRLCWSRSGSRHKIAQVGQTLHQNLGRMWERRASRPNALAKRGVCATEANAAGGLQERGRQKWPPEVRGRAAQTLVGVGRTELGWGRPSVHLHCWMRRCRK